MGEEASCRHQHVYSPFTTILCLSQSCKGLSSRLGQLPVQGGSLCLAMMQQPSAGKLPLGGAPAQVPLQVSTPVLPAAWQYAPSLCCMQCALRNSTMHHAACIMHHAHSIMQYIVLLCRLQVAVALAVCTHKYALQPLVMLCLPDEDIFNVYYKYNPSSFQ